jgi:hypothetical protein
MIGVEEAADLPEIPSIPRKGTRLGNWLTRETGERIAGRSRSVDRQ